MKPRKVTLSLSADQLDALIDGLDAMYYPTLSDEDHDRLRRYLSDRYSVAQGVE
jgi:hypothetical protein